MNLKYLLTSFLFSSNFVSSLVEGRSKGSSKSKETSFFNDPRDFNSCEPLNFVLGADTPSVLLVGTFHIKEKANSYCLDKVTKGKQHTILLEGIATNITKCSGDSFINPAPKRSCGTWENPENLKQTLSIMRKEDRIEQSMASGVNIVVQFFIQNNINNRQVILEGIKITKLKITPEKYGENFDVTLKAWTYVESQILKNVKMEDIEYIPKQYLTVDKKSGDSSRFNESQKTRDQDLLSSIYMACNEYKKTGKKTVLIAGRTHFDNNLSEIQKIAENGECGSIAYYRNNEK